MGIVAFTQETTKVIIDDKEGQIAGTGHTCPEKKI